MLNFDENKLRERLAEMPLSCRLAFAVAVAGRLLPCYERYARLKKHLPLERPKQIIDGLLRKIDAGDTMVDGWPAILEEVMDLIPEEDPDDAGFLDLLAQHSLSALAYAVRCFLSGDVQEAAWAGLCEYEAADQAAIKVLKLDLAAPGAEMAILSHPFVQRVFEVQDADLQLLRRGEIKEVLGRSRAQPTFSDEALDRFA